jgi:hypothetical protein
MQTLFAISGVLAAAALCLRSLHELAGMLRHFAPERMTEAELFDPFLLMKSEVLSADGKSHLLRFIAYFLATVVLSYAVFLYAW